MQIIPLEQVEGHLAEIIQNLPPGDEVVITLADKPVARLVGASRRARPGPGLAKEMITILAEDDEHLKDFAEYMP